MHCSQNSKTKSAKKIGLEEHSGTEDQEKPISLICKLLTRLLKSTSHNKSHLLPSPFLIYKAYFKTQSKKEKKATNNKNK